jgi:ribosomal protein L34E
MYERATKKQVKRKTEKRTRAQVGQKPPWWWNCAQDGSDLGKISDGKNEGVYTLRQVSRMHRTAERDLGEMTLLCNKVKTVGDWG